MLVFIFILFSCWHQPLRGPLTQEEIKTSLGDLYLLMQVSQNVSGKRMLDFLASDDGRPFYMLNLNNRPEKTEENEREAKAYGSYMLPRLFRRACYPVLFTNRMSTIGNTMGETFDEIDEVVIVRYRSRRDFLDIISNETFHSKVQHKFASLDAWFAAPMTYRPLITPMRLLALLLLFIGVMSSTLLRYKRGRP